MLRKNFEFLRKCANFGRNFLAFSTSSTAYVRRNKAKRPRVYSERPYVDEHENQKKLAERKKLALALKMLPKKTEDMPVDFGDYNPYSREKKQCILCRTKVELDYKNSRLLGQFISPFSGRLFEKHYTGLCHHQYEKVKGLIALSRKCGYMPVFLREPRFAKDPKLFDPLKPSRRNPY